MPAWTLPTAYRKPELEVNASKLRAQWMLLQLILCNDTESFHAYVGSLYPDAKHTCKADCNSMDRQHCSFRDHLQAQIGVYRRDSGHDQDVHIHTLGQ